MKYKEAEIETKIKELLNKDFLDKLKEIGKLYGWSGDYVEIADFIKNLHEYYGIEIEDEDLEPYEIEDE